jgi:hypothetical protein
MIPFAITLRKGEKTHRADIIDVPKGSNIVHPFLRAVRSCGTFKIGVGTGIDLIDEEDKIVLAGSILLHTEGELPIHDFELCACGIYACMLTQIARVVKGITHNLLGIGFIRLDAAQRVISKVFDKFGIDGRYEKIGVSKSLEHRLVVTTSVLYDVACISIQTVDKGNEFPDAAFGVEHLEGTGKEFSAGLERGNHALSFGDINTNSIHLNPSKQ